MFDQFIQFINRDHHVSCSEKINCYLLSLYTAKYTMFLLIESIPCRNVYQLIFRDAQMIAIVTWVTNIDYTYAKTNITQCSMMCCRRQGVTLEAIKHVHVHHTHSIWFTVTSVSSLNGHDMLTFEVTGITESAWRQIPHGIPQSFAAGEGWHDTADHGTSHSLLLTSIKPMTNKQMISSWGGGGVV